MKKESIFIILILSFAMLAFSVNAFAAVTKTLKKDTDLRPVNWSKDSTLRFKTGKISVNFIEGGVIAGTIANNYSLGIYGDMSFKVVFKAGTRIRFESSGGVKEGVLASNTNLYIEYSRANVLFKGGTRAFFGRMGGITVGTLASDTSLPLAKGGFEIFKAGTQVKFDGYGKVTSASAITSGDADESNPFAGIYQGTFSGPAKGTVQASSDGSKFSVLLKYENGLLLHATGTVDSKGNIYCEKSGGVCKGKFNGNNSCSGTWSHLANSGRWQVKRIK